jgi:Acetyltransferase (GNAT) domain
MPMGDGTMMRGMSVSALAPVSIVSPAPRDVWDRLIASDPNSLPSQTGRWLDAVCSVAGLEDASRLYQAGDGRLVVLPLVRRKVLGVPLLEASLPYGWGPGGLVAERGLLRPDDVRAVLADLTSRRVPLVRLRPSAATGMIWDEAVPPATIRRPHMAQTLDLRGGFDEVWHARFKSDTRSRVRRAERHGVVIERDDTGRLISVFQELYRKSVARWARHDGRHLLLARWRAARQEPNSKLRTVSAVMGASCRTYVAFVDGRAAAAIVVLLGGAGAAYWRGAMDEHTIGKTYANYLLHCTAIKDACDAGCSAYHMGDSAPGSKLAQFKSRFGAEERQYASYRIERVPLTAATDLARGTVGQAFRGWPGRS